MISFTYRYVSNWVNVLMVAVTFLSVLGSNDSLAQSRAVDSLRMALLSDHEDTLKVVHYYELGGMFEMTLPDTAMAYYNKALALANKLHYHRGIAAYASNAVVILNGRGKFKEALELSLESLHLYEKQGSKADLATAYINVGSEWQYLSDFQQAASAYLSALRYAEGAKNLRLRRIATNNVASVFIELHDFDKGIRYAEQALALADTLEDDYARASSMYNIATAEVYRKNYDEALRLYHGISTLADKTDDYILSLDGWLGLGDVYREKGDLAKAEQYYDKVITYASHKDAPEYTMYACMGLSDLHVSLHHEAQALAYAERGMALAKQLGSRNELKDLYLKVSVLKEKSGDWPEALKYRKQFEALNDSVLGEKSQTNISTLEIRYQTEKKEATICQLEAAKKIQELTIREKNDMNYVLIAVSLAILAIATLGYFNYRQKQRLQSQRIIELEAERKLLAAEAVLRGEEQERVRLAKDLHDGLGGMLSGIRHAFAVIRSKLNLDHEIGETFDRNVVMIDNALHEMRRVAHNMMPEALVKFGLQAAVDDFCKGINSSGVIRLSFQMIGDGATPVSQSLSIAVYRIIQELVHNSIRHGHATEAFIQIAREPSLISLTVEDNGHGFDVDILQSSTGLGWSGIQNRINFFKGVVHLTSNPTEGTSVHIEIPLNPGELKAAE